MSQVSRIVCSVLAIGLAAGVAGQAAAQAPWPQSTVKIVVPYPPGGGADGLPRVLIDGLSRKWGQPVVIENRSGAGGNVGAEVASRAAPDGYTFLATPSPVFTINPTLYKKLNYDPTAFKPVVMMGEIPSAITIHPSLGVANVKELIAKAKKETIAYGSQGNGSTSHLAAAMFEHLAGVKLNHVPYRGSGPLVNDLVGGHVKISFDNLASGIAHHKAGKLKFLAITDDKRSEFVPEVPTAIQEGVKDFVAVARFVIGAPAGTPDAIIKKFNADAVELLKTPEVRAKYAGMGAIPIGGSVEDMAKFIASDRKRWADVIKAANIPQVE